ncbi:DUF4267 domain-containing protein [Streptomyces sp. NPDC056105]|uniref:DUF4267 domain-containing protein n=1 Tax=Streptomyces sp. NPDC056105 TaxID=3345714 RepID=UPI0035E0B868
MGDQQAAPQSPFQTGPLQQPKLLVLLVLLLTGQRRALGWAMAAITFVPIGDMVIVLSNRDRPPPPTGSTAPPPRASR